VQIPTSLRRIGLLPLALLCLGATAACSGSSGPAPTAARSAPAPSFADFDANGDKKIDAVEFQRLQNILLRRSDADKNGRLSKDEVKHILGDNASFEALDANRDGRIDAAEFPKIADELFRRIDADGNRALDLQEYRNLMEMTAPAPPPMREPPHEATDPLRNRGGLGY
jgi:hypothetical protein